MTLNELKPAHAAIGEKPRALHALWNELRADRMAPKREDFTLGRVRRLTPWIWTVDVVGADYRFRLAGDRVSQFLGYRYSGQLLSEVPESPFFERLGHLLTHCVAHRRPAAFGPVRSLREHKEHLEVETVLLPLSEDGVAVTGVMGALETWPLGTMTKRRTPISSI